MAETHAAIDVVPQSSSTALVKQPRRRRQNRLWIGIPLMLGVVVIMWLWSPSSTVTAPDAQVGEHARSLQAAVDFCDSTGLAEVGGIYPPDIFTYKQICDGAWVLHLLGALYMFLALSIVCDEFFVPALEVIVERFKISDDVAGATFMAAGGSAPELATSLIGTFVAVSDVGFGTIVGSAVFNVLFVIGCCAMLSKELLVLTWWPLARDSLYYSVTLATLIVFFLDGKIEWWEALIQFTLYIGYVVEMAHNVQLYKFTRGILGIRDPVSPAPSSTVGFDAESGSGDGTSTTSSGKPRARRGSVIDRANAAAGVSSARATFHAHVLHLMFYETDPKGKGVTKDKDNRFSRAVKIVMERTKAADEPPRSPAANRMLAAAAAASSKDPASDAGGVAKDVEAAAAGADGASDPEKGAVGAATTTAGGKTGSAVTTTGGAVAASAADKSGRVASSGGTGATDHPPTPDGSGALTPLKDEDDDDEEDEEDGDTVEDMLRLPSSCCGRVWWVFAAPLTFSLAYTIPDVRMKGRSNWYPISFAMSILWIAVHSNFMVWWATTVGRALKIPDNVMGLTFLAAGTSVPDLLTSVLVARQGLGDMAVSSSIGSNIFDVTVGLPFPWIIKTLIDSAPVTVNSAGLRFSVFLLFLMLITVIVSIAVSGWKLSKSLGLGMFFLYIIFLTVSLLVESGQIMPPF